MYQPIKKIVIGLSHTYLDAEIIDYSNFLAEVTEVDHIYFVHIINLNLPDKVVAEFPNLEKDALVERKKEVENIVKSHWVATKRVVSHSVEIIQSSNNIKGLLGSISKFDADLVVIGRVKDKRKTSIFTQRLARRSPCQILILPEGAYKRIDGGMKIKNILVPIDFSTYSSIALDRAIRFARRNKDKHEIEIVCQYVYRLPSGYHLSGKSEDEFAKIMCTNAKEGWEEFIQDIDIEDVNIRIVFSRDINNDLTSDIRDLAIEIDADIIVIGSKGRSGTAALFLGSFAEKLITNTTNFSLLVVRKKKEYDGILDRIKKL
jgi:nucleotide-binding universal stress UspA family protein